MAAEPGLVTLPVLRPTVADGGALIPLREVTGQDANVEVKTKVTNAGIASATVIVRFSITCTSSAIEGPGELVVPPGAATAARQDAGVDAWKHRAGSPDVVPQES